MAQNMAHILIPIRFRFLKIPVAWELTANPKADEVFCGRLKKWQLPDGVKLSELDGWRCRDEFFSLPDNDSTQLAEFLNRVGVWSSDTEPSALIHWTKSPLYAHAEDVWQFREELKAALLYRKYFKDNVTPVLPKPKTLTDLISQGHPANNFPLTFELTNIAAGVVTITNARRMLIATVLADVARGIRFKVCRRKDCDRQPIFSIESKHERDFCCMYCGHLFSLRKTRAEDRANKRAEKGRRIR